MGEIRVGCLSQSAAACERVDHKVRGGSIRTSDTHDGRERNKFTLALSKTAS
jgi:hypothetical protein